MKEIRSRTVSETVQTECRPISFDEFCDEVLALKATKSKGYRDYVSILLGRLRSLGASSTEDLTPSLVGKLVSHVVEDLRLSPETARGNLVILKSITAHAVKFGYLSVSPFRGRRITDWLGPKALRPPRHHTPTEIRAVLDHLRSLIELRQGVRKWETARLHALVATIAYLGLRLKEVEHLRVDAVDLVNEVVRPPDFAPGYRRKPSPQRCLNLPRQLAEIIEIWLYLREELRPGVVAESEWLFPSRTGFTPWTSGGPNSRPWARIFAAGADAGVAGFSASSLRMSIMAPWWER